MTALPCICFLFPLFYCNNLLLMIAAYTIQVTISLLVAKMENYVGLTWISLLNLIEFSSM